LIIDKLPVEVPRGDRHRAAEKAHDLLSAFVSDLLLFVSEINEVMISQDGVRNRYAVWRVEDRAEHMLVLQVQQR